MLNCAEVVLCGGRGQSMDSPEAFLRLRLGTRAPARRASAATGRRVGGGCSRPGPGSAATTAGGPTHAQPAEGLRTAGGNRGRDCGQSREGPSCLCRGLRRTPPGTGVCSPRCESAAGSGTAIPLHRRLAKPLGRGLPHQRLAPCQILVGSRQLPRRCCLTCC